MSIPYDELDNEPWWGQETVSAAMETTGDRWRAHWDVSRSLIGCKGDNNHLKGRHRSRDWTRNSQYCTNRSYADSSTRDSSPPTVEAGNRLRAYDIDGMPAQERYAFNRRLDEAVRAGRLPCVAEWWGTFDGQTVVGWYQGHESTSDDSHLYHTHIGIWSDSVNDEAQLALLGDIILGVDMDEASIATAVWAKVIGSQSLGDKPAGDFLKQGQLAKQEATAAKDAVTALGVAVAAIPTEPVQAAPIDPAALKAVLLDPEVLAAYAKAVNDDQHARSAE